MDQPCCFDCTTSKRLEAVLEENKKLLQKIDNLEKEIKEVLKPVSRVSK